MNPQTHPLDFPEVQQLMNQFLVDVIFEYREQEIKDWLQGLSLVDIESIVNRPGHEILKANRFIIPFTFLHYAVVPNPQITDALKLYLYDHAIFPKGNAVIAKTILHFERIFKGKQQFIHYPNNAGHKSY